MTLGTTLRKSPTHWKFRHTSLGPDGRRYLIWASDGPKHSEEIPLGEVPIGSRAELEIVNSQLWTPNTLADEGEKDILDVYFDDVAVRDVIKVLQERTQAVAVGNNDHPLTASDCRTDVGVPNAPDALDSVLQTFGERELIVRHMGVAWIPHRIPFVVGR